MRKIFLIHFFALVAIVSSQAQTNPQKHHTASRIADGAIQIDGILDEAAWQGLPIADGFVQNEPNPGEPATFDTQVRLAYDDEAIFVAALLLDESPDKILKQLSPRDQRENTSVFGVSIDPYQATQLGFSFFVTTPGVQQDFLVTNDGEDITWNAVWQSATSITDNGWIVEMRIPYSAIRFPKSEIQTWNIQFFREIRRSRETSYWNEVKPTVNGLLTQFGALDGIKNIEPPVRLSITPFVTAYTDVANPQNGPQSSDTYYNAGMDLKYGINDAFTLDMTLIPDFGQTQSDNQVLNLSPFEVFFEENRQFFTEGVELFQKSGLFYSRRIGGRPVNAFDAYSSLSVEEEVTELPQQSKLYNASKVSGRTASGLGVGVINAISRPSDAVITNTRTGISRRVEVDPLTNYNVLVLDQNLRANSSITLTNTNVWRSGSTYDANATALNFDIKNLDQSYGVAGNVKVSQRYDGSGNDVGHAYFLRLSKLSGNIQGGIEHVVESDNYNPNDLGFLFSPNERSFAGFIQYNQYNPKNENIQLYRYGANVFYSRLYDPNKFADFGINFNGFLLFKSRNAIGGNLRFEPVDTYNYFEPRTSDFSERLAFAKNIRFNASFSSDYRKVLAINLGGTRRWFDDDGRSVWEVRIGPRIRFSDHLSMILETNLRLIDHEPGYVNRQFVESLAGVDASKILMGRRDRDQTESILNVNYIFNDKMSLSTRIRHLWDRVEYQGFGWLRGDGYLDEVGLAEGERTIFDRNFNQFNVDMVYTWRFAPGSDLVVVWKNAISDLNQAYDRSYWQNLGSLDEGNRYDSFSIKAIYFLDYLYLKR